MTQVSTKREKKEINERVGWTLYNLRRGHLRVLGSIDDGGIRAFFPLTDSFIMAPDGSFIGEDDDAP